MKRLFVVILLLLPVILFNAFTPKGIDVIHSLPQDSLSQDRLKHVNEIKEMIKGKEDMPADSVYKNLQAISGFKAGLLPLVMNKWSIALGVSCGYCHEKGSWESDAKPEKLIARKMAGVSSVVIDYLKTIKELKTKNPVINCATCHRGQIKPALNVEGVR